MPFHQMTVTEAKQDCATRLRRNGITYERLSAKTLTIGLFVEIYGWSGATPLRTIFTGLAKPSEGGYVPQIKSRSDLKPGQVFIQ